MFRMIVNRISQSLISILIVTLLVFLFMNMSGDPARLLLPPSATEDQVEAMQQKMGLDKPVTIRYINFLKKAIQGDFGTSFRKNEPALKVVLRHLPATFELSLIALLISSLISIPLGILAAIKRGSIIDFLSMTISVLGQSTPVFWTGELLILFFSVTLQWFPTGGKGDWTNLVLPSIALSWYISAMMTRMVRSSMLEVIGEDYIRTARAKGLTEITVTLKHAFRNALIPIITIFGLQAGTILVGTVVAEIVFSWPGLGRATIYAVLGRDYPVVLASVFLFTLIFITINLIVDITYTLIDPRIRY